MGFASRVWEDGQTPSPEIHGILRDTVNKRAVRIPLECILVLCVYITLYSSNLFSGGNDITDETKSDSGEALKRKSSQQTFVRSTNKLEDAI